MVFMEEPSSHHGSDKGCPNPRNADVLDPEPMAGRPPTRHAVSQNLPCRGFQKAFGLPKHFAVVTEFP